MKVFLVIFLSIFLLSCNNVNNNNINLQNDNLVSEAFFDTLDIDEFKKELSSTWVVLIDVRTPEELKKYWKISDNQVNIDINNKNFAIQINNLDKTKKYLIYCWHWNRSKVARDYMKSQWFFYVKDLKWWIDAWEKAWEKIIKE